MRTGPYTKVLQECLKSMLKTIKLMCFMLNNCIHVHNNLYLIIIYMHTSRDLEYGLLHLSPVSLYNINYLA